jgi:hypothetical protein
LRVYKKKDARYPGYLRVRIAYPLTKHLQPKMSVRIKGRGPMEIALRYENVPHFFICGCIGHAVANCEEGETEDNGVRFGIELRATQPHRVRDIVVQSGASRVARLLFHVGVGMGTISGSSGMANSGQTTQIHTPRRESKGTNV